MKSIIILIIIVTLGLGAYWYLQPNSNESGIQDSYQSGAVSDLTVEEKLYVEERTQSQLIDKQEELMREAGVPEAEIQARTQRLEGQLQEAMNDL